MIFVIPDRRVAASPESITTIGAGLSRPVVMDSGFLALLGPGMTAGNDGYDPAASAFSICGSSTEA